MQLMPFSPPLTCLENAQDGPYSETALHVACGLGHERVVELLLQRGDLNYVARDAHGRTPLYTAVQGTRLMQFKGHVHVMWMRESWLRGLKRADF
jgi:hypothetical protein